MGMGATPPMPCYSSDEAPFVTGNKFVADGGITARSD
jgi:hypothetical protein